MLNLSQVESEKSFAPIKPGESVKVKLGKVEITPDGHLDFHFNGTDPENAGTFKPRFWASDLDPNSDRYSAENAEVKLKHIKQILEAYLNNNAVEKVQGRNAAEFFAGVQAALTPDVIDVEATMKIVYKFNSDSLCQIPKYGAFISTAFRPRGLKLRTAEDQNGIPYERVLPLEHYGAVADTGSSSDDAPFGVTEEDEVPFGN